MSFLVVIMKKRQLTLMVKKGWQIMKNCKEVERDKAYEAYSHFKFSKIVKECGIKVEEDRFVEPVRVTSKDLNPRGNKHW